MKNQFYKIGLRMQLWPAAKCTSEYFTPGFYLPTPELLWSSNKEEWRGCPVLLDSVVPKRNKARHWNVKDR